LNELASLDDMLLLAISLVLSSLAIMVASQRPVARVLLYSATAAYRHDSIPVAIEALQAHGSSINVAFDSTEDSGRFNDEELAAYDAIVFLSTTGEGGHMIYA
jgi:Trehalose utilisation